MDSGEKISEPFRLDSDENGQIFDFEPLCLDLPDFSGVKAG